MSLYFASSPKHCAKQGLDVKKLNKRLLYTLFTLLLTAGSAAVLIFLILRPAKPEFHLKDAALYQLSLSSPYNLLNSTVQFTLVSKNPNTRVGVYYDQLRAYASYKGQQITTEAELPPFYQGHEDTTLLSASLYGAGVPVAASFGYEVGRDQVAGRMVLRVRLDGRLRWKVGSWVSGRYHVDVDCAAVVGFGNGGGGASGLLNTMQGTQCSTTV